MDRTTETIGELYNHAIVQTAKGLPVFVVEVSKILFMLIAGDG